MLDGPLETNYDQLLLTYDFVSKTDKGHTTNVILFDFSKAFDVVIHSLFIDKP